MIYKTSHVKYRVPVAVVYSSDIGVVFKRVFKSMKAAARCATKYNSIVIPL